MSLKNKVQKRISAALAMTLLFSSFAPVTSTYVHAKVTDESVEMAEVDETALNNALFEAAEEYSRENTVLLPNGGTVSTLEAAGDKGRNVIDFNEGWAFLHANTDTVISGTGNEQRTNFVKRGLDEVEAYPTEEIIKPNYDDSQWRTVNTPHDYAIELGPVGGGGANSSTGQYPAGLGYYRKKFFVPQDIKTNNESVTIDFEGVYMHSFVYLNGELIGNYPSGYTGFAYDLTDKLKYGQENVLVVKVNAATPSSRWYHGGGITRPVRMIVTGPNSIDRHGVTLTSPDLEKYYKDNGSAQLNVNTDWARRGGPNSEVHMKVSVYDETGTLVATEESQKESMAGPGPASSNITLTIPNVKLWYPWNLQKYGTPYLYTVKTELWATIDGQEGLRLMDVVEDKFGFRWFEIEEADPDDPNTGGFYINDKYTKLNGANMHHDTGALGGVTNRDAQSRQLDIMKDMGVNLFRTSHNPVGRDILRLCSEKGIMVMEEAFDSWGVFRAKWDFGHFFFYPVPTDWEGLAPNGFDGSQLTDLLGVQYPGVKYTWGTWVIQEMMRSARNEASILFWSMGNEVQGDRPSFSQEDVDAGNAPPDWNAVRGTPDWYDGTKYDDETVTGLPFNTRNDDYDGYTIGNASIEGTQMDRYTEGVRLCEDAKAVDSTRIIMFTTDQIRTPHEGGRQYDQTQPGNIWGYVMRYLGIMAGQYITPGAVNVLTDRFNGSTVGREYAAFYETETNASPMGRGVYFASRSRAVPSSSVPGQYGGSGYANTFSSFGGSYEVSIKRDRDRKDSLGITIWTGIDYLGEAQGMGGPQTKNGWGAVDLAGFPKDYFYLQKMAWMDPEIEKFVHLMPTDWSSWVPGEPVDVWVYSNVQTAELFLNGKSLGKKSYDVKTTDYGKDYLETSNATLDDTSPGTRQLASNPGGYVSPEGTKIKSASGDSKIAEGAPHGDLRLVWEDVPYEPGILEVKAYDNPKSSVVVATDRQVTATVPYTIEMNPYKDRTVMTADGQSLIAVECDIVDENGNMVDKANDLVEFYVSGPGAIVGVDSGENSAFDATMKWGNVQQNSYSQHTAYNGKVMVMVQSLKGQTGDIQLIARAKNMQPGIVNLKATEDGSGEAPRQYKITPELKTIKQEAFYTPIGVVPTLPKKASLLYSDPVVGDFTVTKPVTWNTTILQSQVAEAGQVELQGTIEGIGEKAKANVYVVAADAKGDISTNSFTGTTLPERRSQPAANAYRWEDLPEDSDVRNGALATSSYATANPNVMLQDNNSNWQNTFASRMNSQLNTRYHNESAPYSTVQFYWDKYKTFDKIDLTFVTSDPNGNNQGTKVPSAFKVQYWNGMEWIDVSNPKYNVPSTGINRVVEISFDAVYADKVRVGMTNATPWTTDGGIRIQSAVITGYTMGDVVFKDKLRTALDEAEELQKDEYTAETWEDFTIARDAAEVVYKNKDTTQEEVDQAVQALKKAMADLKEQEYDILVDKSIKNGTVTSNVSKAKAGETVTIAAEAFEGYYLTPGSLKVVKSDDANVQVAISPDNSFTMPGYAVTIKAEFSKLNTIQADDTIKNGRVTSDKSSARPGETVKITAEPDKGWYLRPGTLMAVNAEDADEKVEITADDTFIMPDFNVVVTAEFFNPDAAELEELKNIHALLAEEVEERSIALENAMQELKTAQEKIEQAGNEEEKAAAYEEALRLASIVADKSGQVKEASQNSAEIAQIVAEKTQAKADEEIKKASEAAAAAQKEAEEAKKQLEAEKEKAEAAKEDAEAQKKLVEELKKQVELQRQERVNEVIAKIAAIGAVTKNSQTAIKAAEDAYNALDEEQKKLVTNYKVLTEARAAYNGLAAVPEKDSRHTAGKYWYKVTKSAEKGGTVVVLRPTSKRMKTAVIPETIKLNGYTFKVTSIADKAFLNNRQLTSVMIKKNIQKIGKQAFAGCSKLKTVNIKTTSLKKNSIGKNAFKGIKKTATIKVPKKKLTAYKKLLKTSAGYKKTMRIKY